MQPNAPLDRRTFLAAGAALSSTLILPNSMQETRLKDPVPFPELPFPEDALEPVISAETVHTHYGKHHRTYHSKAIKATEGTELQGASMSEIMQSASGEAKRQSLFNSAAQAWNHDFYWKSMKAGGGGHPTGKLERVITSNFGNYENFRVRFTEVCMKHFASGWGWLVIIDNKAIVTTTNNAENPLVMGHKPLLTLDLWEHAYYLDHKNVRADYIRGYLDKLINWDFAALNYKT